MARYSRVFTAEERRKSHAAQLGIPLSEYDARIAAGQKWCWHCRCWCDRADFGPNRSNADGLQPMCGECRRAYSRACGHKHQRAYRARLAAARQSVQR